MASCAQWEWDSSTAMCICGIDSRRLNNGKTDWTVAQVSKSRSWDLRKRFGPTTHLGRVKRQVQVERLYNFNEISQLDMNFGTWSGSNLSPVAPSRPEMGAEWFSLVVQLEQKTVSHLPVPKWCRCVDIMGWRKASSYTVPAYVVDAADCKLTRHWKSIFSDHRNREVGH